MTLKNWTTLKFLGCGGRKDSRDNKSSNIGLEMDGRIEYDKCRVSTTFFTSVKNNLVSKLPPSSGEYCEVYRQRYYAHLVS